MAAPHQFITFLEAWVTRLFVALGGFAGAVRIVEWWRQRPKIIGEIEANIIGTITQQGTVTQQAKEIGSHIMLLVYAVNARVSPTAIKGWFLTIRTQDGKMAQGEQFEIPEGFRLSADDGTRYPFAFEKARLYDLTSEHVLEREKGVRGWLRFIVKDISTEQIYRSELMLKGIDSLGRTHKLKKYQPSRNKTNKMTIYIPGSGYSTK